MSLDHFDAELKDAEAIAHYVQSLSTCEVDDEFIREYFHGCGAVLKWVPINELQEGDPDSNVKDDDKESLYMDMPTESCPPILIENGKVVDGNHRFRVTQKKGLLGIWAYEVLELPSNDLDIGCDF